MATQIGTAWIQIKPSLNGVSNDIKKALGDGTASASTDFGNKFKSSFLLAAKSSFSDAFSEFGRRSDTAFSQFMTAAKVGFSAATAGVVLLARQLDGASGSQQAFTANMKLAGESNEATARTFKLLQDYANKSIYSLSDMTSTAGILASTGVKNAAELVKSFGNMAAAAENPQQAIKSISQQMAQVNGKGFVQTMDFRIMQEQASGPLKLVQDRLMELNHWNGDQFREALSNGEISAQMLNQAILDVGNNPVLNDLATKPRTIGDAWEAFTSTIVSNLSTSASWTDTQKRVVGWLTQASEWVGKNQDAIDGWISKTLDAVEGAAKWISENKELVQMIVTTVVAFKALQIATGGVRAVVDTLSPYAKIVKGTLELAIGGAQTLIGKFGELSSASKTADQVAGGVDKMSTASKNAPKTFAFGDSIASFFKNIGQVMSGAVEAVVSPLKTLLSGVGEAIAGFFKAFSNPQLLIGALVFAAASAAVAAAILLVGGAIGIVTPGLGNFLDSVLLPLGAFIVGSLITALFALTGAIVILTTQAVIPLVNAVAGGLIGAFDAASGFISAAGNAISGVVWSISGGISSVINSIANLIRSTSNTDWYGVGFGITRNFSAGLIDGLASLLQDSLNKMINQLLNIPALGSALKSAGFKANPIDLSGFKLGRRAAGGAVFGPGGPTSDSIPMALSNGEYVIRAAAAQKIGYANLDNLNSSGEIGGGTTYGDIIINGADKDPKEIAYEVSRIIAGGRARVIG